MDITNLSLKQPFLTSLEDALIEELKCPTCYDIMFKPIYHCNRGHSVCSNCYEPGKYCRTCGSLIQNNRSHHLETISALLKYPCKYFGDGCQKRFHFLRLKQHELECQTRTFKCPLRYATKCPFIGNKKQLVFHCQLVHGEFTFVSIKHFEQCMLYESILNKHRQASKRTGTIPKTTFQSFYLYYSGDILFQGVVHLNPKHIMVRMFRISPQSELGDRYDFFIKLYDSDDHLLATYREFCSVTDGWQELLFDERGCIQISLEMFKFCKYYTLEFRELPEDVRENGL